MATRRPIFGVRSANYQIGYVEGNKAFDMLGLARANYDERSGLLHDRADDRVLGYISLRNLFVGVKLVGEELFLGTPSVTQVQPPAGSDGDRDRGSGFSPAEDPIASQGRSGVVDVASAATSRSGAPGRMNFAELSQVDAVPRESQALAWSAGVMGAALPEGEASSADPRDGTSHVPDNREPSSRNSPVEHDENPVARGRKADVQSIRWQEADPADASAQKLTVIGTGHDERLGSVEPLNGSLGPSQETPGHHDDTAAD